MIQAGKLNHTIHIEREAESVGATGQVTKSWAVKHTVSAEVVQLSASEFLAGFGDAQSNNVVFRIRYRAGITTADRVRFDGRTYDIKELAQIGRRRGIEIKAVATT